MKTSLSPKFPYSETIHSIQSGSDYVPQFYSQNMMAIIITLWYAKDREFPHPKAFPFLLGDVYKNLIIMLFLQRRE